MSRSQETTAFNTGQTQNQSYYTNAQNSYTNAQNDVGEYQNQLSSYAAANPYVQGGQFQTAENQQLANTSDAAAQAAGEALQSQALRTGENSAGGVAATEAMEQSNERNLSGQEASATQSRIADQAKYNQSVLQASALPEQMESTLAGQQGNLAGGALGEEQKAGETPSWTDEFGDAFGQGLGGGLGKALGGAASAGIAACWVAAELYGGWTDPRTILLREWIFGPFAATLAGSFLSHMYWRFGERLASGIRKSKALRFCMRRIFDRALVRAMEWKG